MYTLRKVNQTTKTETNIYLGKTYTVVDGDSSEFRSTYERVFECTTSDNKDFPVYGFVIVGNEDYPLYFGDANYIMTESGRTFSNICPKLAK